MPAPDEQRATGRPFTLAVCTACGTPPDDGLMPALRAVVSQCPHAILVVTRCLLGELTCATRSPGGPMLLLQPCTAERVPVAAVQWIGPVVTGDDVRAACDWIRAGRWTRETLPVRLRAELNLARAGRMN
ncbi:hypothetical protein [Mycolicibacterium arseniciresistens]|uniref:Uncharacterized protein n=1 Tax=Mycolicibacterium arseniciresistens TaxID=3062257 RepID=A0ABT8UFI2_9MYCO|nr:hypothetical protein [Mycolicibacterium arseniciresistens]MDO3636546.1 hypothetical protein [Mycolicibacterium arseniciresistens]